MNNTLTFKDLGGVGVSSCSGSTRAMWGLDFLSGTIKVRVADPLGIKKVIFNPPATIVYWEDGEKTVVRCDKDDTYNREMGIALCIAKKALNNSSRKLNDALALAEEKKEGK